MNSDASSSSTQQATKHSGLSPDDAMACSLSCLLDNELNGAETERLITAISNLKDTQKKADILAKAGLYQAIGQLCTEYRPDISSTLDPHFSTQVIQHIQQDPPFKPQHTVTSIKRHTTKWSSWIPTAAAACLCLVIGWQFIQPPSTVPTSQLTETPSFARNDTSPSFLTTTPQSFEAYPTPTPQLAVSQPAAYNRSTQKPSLQDFAKLAAADKAKFNRYFMMHTGSARIAGPANAITLARVVDLEEAPSTIPVSAPVRLNTIPVNHQP